MIQPSFKHGYALHASQAKYPSLHTGLIGAWCPSLGNTGKTLFDLSGRGRNGTLTNMTLADAWVISGGKYALSFDAVNDFVNCGSIDSGQMYSIAAWARANDFTSRAIISNYNLPGTLAQYDMRMGGAGRFELFYQNASGFRNGLGPANLSVATWYHVVWVNAANSDAGQSLYVNGKPQSLSFSNSGTPGVPASGFGSTSIGRAGDFNGGLFNGTIDDVRIYNRVLTANEIALLYKGGRGVAYQRRESSHALATGTRRRRAMVIMGAA